MAEPHVSLDPEGLNPVERKLRGQLRAVAESIVEERRQQAG